MIHKLLRLPLPGAALLAALLLGACSQPQTRVEDTALEDLMARLPGRYDNSAQVRADRRSGAAQPQPALDLLIVPANAALVGKSAFYVRETASGDERRVFSQYIWVFGRTVELHGAPHGHGADGQDAAHGHLEQHIYLFKEPQRWLNVGQDPEMLQSLLPRDLERLTGCDLLWTATTDGFKAERGAHGCDPEARYEGQLIEQRIELHGSKLSLLEQQITPDGLVAAPAGSADEYYRFVRRGAAN